MSCAVQELERGISQTEDFLYDLRNAETYKSTLLRSASPIFRALHHQDIIVTTQVARLQDLLQQLSGLQLAVVPSQQRNVSRRIGLSNAEVEEHEEIEGPGTRSSAQLRGIHHVGDSHEHHLRHAGVFERMQHLKTLLAQAKTSSTGIRTASPGIIDSAATTTTSSTTRGVPGRTDHSDHDRHTNNTLSSDRLRRKGSLAGQ